MSENETVVGRVTFGSAEKMEIDSRVESKLIALREQRREQIKSFVDGVLIGFLIAYFFYNLLPKNDTKSV